MGNFLKQQAGVQKTFHVDLPLEVDILRGPRK